MWLVYNNDNKGKVEIFSTFEHARDRAAAYNAGSTLGSARWGVYGAHPTYNNNKEGGSCVAKVKDVTKPASVVSSYGSNHLRENE